MALSDRLKKLFSTKIIITPSTSGGLKIADTNQVQSAMMNGLLHKYAGLYSSMAGGTGKSQQLFMAAQRIALFKDYECISGDTKILLPSGDNLTIKELSEKYPTKNDTFYVYSYNQNTDTVCLGTAHSVRKTKTELTYKVTFNNGKYIIATASHPFLLKTGKYCTVDKLRPGDLVMSFDQYKIGSPFCHKNVDCKIESIVEYKILDVYDMTVDKYHNFATDSCFVHNSMEQDSIISSALDIYSDESTLKSEYGDVLTIYSENEKIKKVLTNLFYDILNIEFNLWPWVRNMCKYGDFFLHLNISDKYGIVNVTPLSPYDVARIEGDDKTGDPNIITFEFTTGDHRHTNKQYTSSTLQEYEVAHFRLLGDSNYLPYGKSMIEGARKTWKQVSLMEDAMLIHRIMRAPERRIFKIDIGNIAPAEVESYMKRIMDKMKKTPVMNKDGEYNLRYNMQNLTEDFFLPVRGGDSGTDIDTLSGLQYDTIDDIEYLKHKMMAALKIPKAFLGYEEGIGCIVPETEIPLLSGEVKTVQALINDYNLGITNYVYSLDTTTDTIVPGEITWAGYTNENATIIRVNLDNGKFIDCTPDHRFLTRDGEWIEAKDLQENQTLMPLYIDKDTKNIYQPGTKIYQPMTQFNQLMGDDNIIYETQYLNHKVSSIEFLDVVRDVCDLTIKTYHNFATNAGVIIHNSKATLAAEDVRFGRTIERIQRTVVSELTKIAIVHLMAQGFDRKDLLNFELELTNPSIIYEQEQIEKWDARLNMASTALSDNLLDSDWIYDNIFKFTKEDKEKIRLGLLKDKKRKFRYEQIEQEGNDPVKSHEAIGTPATLQSAASDKGSTDTPDLSNTFDLPEGGSPPGGHEGAGRPKEVPKYSKDGSARGRDPLGSHDMKKSGSGSRKYGKTLALSHYSSLIKSHPFKSTDRKLLAETEDVQRDYLNEVNTKIEDND